MPPLTSSVLHPRFSGENARKVSDDEKRLIIAVMATSELYLVDAETGVATLVDLGGYAVSGDGLVSCERMVLVRMV